MDEFKNDLIELFKKHNILALEDSVEFHISPLYHDDCITTRDVLLKFSQSMTDIEEIREHVNKFGFTDTRNYFNIYKK